MTRYEVANEREAKRLVLSGKYLDHVASSKRGLCIMIPFDSQREFVDWLYHRDASEFFRYCKFQGVKPSVLLRRLKL